MILSNFLFVIQTNVNLGKKLISHSKIILNLVPIQALLYSIKNTLGSSPFLPFKIGIIMLIKQNSFKK
jgi:hypothetical protein